MKFNTLINHAAEILRLALKSVQPADQLMQQYFRARKYIGSKERKYISELVFSHLRNKLLADYCADDIYRAYPDDSPNLMYYSTGLIVTNIIGFEHPDTPKPFDTLSSMPAIISVNQDNFYELVKEALAEVAGCDVRTAGCYVKSAIERFENLREQVEIVKTNGFLHEEDYSLLSSYFSMPEWITRKIFAHYGVYTSFRLLQSLTYPAPVNLRINSMMSSQPSVVAELDKMGIETEVNPMVPSGLVINKRVKIDDTDLYKSGIIEVQDCGSQVISFVLDPQPGKSILDACAGAGGKTIHIACIVNDKAEITASDVDLMKLKEVMKRANRASLYSINTMLIKNEKEPPYDKAFDYVLVDAPCTGMGTVRRTPVIKLKLTERNLRKSSEKQLQLLNLYAGYVKDDGVLVYSTCSLMPEENEQVVEKFLRDNSDFRLAENLNAEFEKHNIKIESTKGFITLMPHTTGSDGFFVAKFIKVQ